MIRFTLTAIVSLIIILGCKENEPIITIVDIGQNNRIELGKQLRIINKFSPKIIALDFYLVPDSLDRDSILVKELTKAKKTVQVVGLHNQIESTNGWDSLEISNSKFKVTYKGFANLSVQDSVLVKELPMQQSFKDETVFSFSYIIALNTYGVKEQFRNKNYQTFNFDLNGLGKNYRFISRKDLLEGNFRKDDLTNKIVIMGYMGKKEDFSYLDKTKTKKINGVEVHAAIIDEIIDR